MENAILYYCSYLYRREGVWTEDKLRGEVGRYSDTRSVTEVGLASRRCAVSSAQVWLDTGVYVGGTANLLPHGNGSLVYHDTEPRTSNYTGEWVAGEMEGTGTMHWRDGDRYEGEWEGGLPSGRGVYSWAGGDTFTGQFRAGLPSGEGVFQGRQQSPLTPTELL